MPKRLVVVDDDPVIRMLVSEYLNAHGHELTVLESGTECLETLSAADPLPDALVLDLIMPDMTGFDVLQKIRADERLKNLPVILLSANADSEKDARQHDVSADYYLLKPFEMPELLKAVDTVTTAD